MKANQSLRNSEEAVSPVIGVILMVAITVVLAAVVFVLVTKLSSNQSDKAPDVSFVRNEADDRLVVNSADAGLTYGEFALTLTKAGSLTATDKVIYGLGFPTTLGAAGNGCEVDGLALQVTTYGTAVARTAGACATSISNSDDAINAAGFIDLCAANAATTAGVSATNVELTLTHIESNKVIAKYTFGTLQACV